MQTKHNTRQVDHLWFLNSWLTVRRPSASGADGVSIIEHRMACGDSPPVHVHRNEDEIFHILDGTLRLRLADAERIAGPGETVIAPRGVPHSFRVESTEGARFLTISTGGEFEAFVRAVSRPAGAFSLPVRAAPTGEMFQTLARAAEKNGMDLLGPPLV